MKSTLPLERCEGEIQIEKQQFLTWRRNVSENCITKLQQSRKSVNAEK
jgi:hypothetical protein